MRDIVSMNNLENIENDFFQSVTHGKLKLNRMIFYLKEFLEGAPDAYYSLIIGTDSHEKDTVDRNKKYIDLVTAIVIHRKGFGGKYFWRKRKVNNIHTLRDKIYAETFASLHFATNFVPLFKKTLNGHCPNYNLEIHVDVGEHGDTREMIREVVGIVTGNGFIAKTKPEAYGASYVADRHA